LLAAGWRVVTGAELEAKWNEGSLKIAEGANALDGARKQFAAEAKRFSALRKRR